MKGLVPLFLGILATFAFSWVGLALVPTLQIGHLEPQTDEEGADPYPVARSGMAERGREVYIANGCMYCHTQQVRPGYAASDISRKWGARRSAPRDYIYERPVLLGTLRMGPDLTNVAKRLPVDDGSAPPPGSTTSTTAASPVPGAAPLAAASPAPAVPASPAGSPAPPPNAPPVSPSPAPSVLPASATSSAPTALSGAAQAQATSANQIDPGQVTTTVSGTPLPYTSDWHHRHLYNPRSITADSTMPSFRFLYEKKRIGAQPSFDALKLDHHEMPKAGWEIVPSYDAKSLVAYLMSLDQTHALKEVDSSGSAAASPAPAAQAAPAVATPAAPAKP